MKLSEFKQSIKDRLVILKVTTIYTFQQETAYWTNNWASLASTFFYTLSMILLVDIIYSNVDIVAGYTRNEMLLFLLMGQVGFYSIWVLISNLKELIIDVNRGNLDLLLVKPIPSLFYVTFKRVRLLSLARDSIPPLIAVIIAIDWQDLNISLGRFIIGFIIAYLGITASYVVHFLASLVVFWKGESSGILSLSIESEHNIGKVIPLEGYPHGLQVAFSSLVPFIITAGFATSAMLNKANPYVLLAWAFVIAMVALIIANIAWRKALKAYTSASS